MMEPTIHLFLLGTPRHGSQHLALAETFIHPVQLLIQINEIRVTTSTISYSHYPNSTESIQCNRGYISPSSYISRHVSNNHMLYRQGICNSGLQSSQQENVKEARRIIKEMKSIGIMPDLFCYNTFLRGLCERNLKLNPSGLVPEALNVMIEMRSYRISPNSISYNILLSCLGRTRRVKESCNILETMKKTGCSPDCISYYLVVRVLYLSGRFGKGNKMVDEMLEQGLQPNCKFYYDLIGVLVGKERPHFAVELLQKMKASALGGYGPVYDVLIPKFCRGGDFEKGRELWDEAMAMGVTLRCSSNLLDPSITEVFKPTRNEEKLRLIECANAKAEEKVRRRTGKTKQTKKKKKILRRMLKKKMKKKKKSAAT